MHLIKNNRPGGDLPLHRVQIAHEQVVRLDRLLVEGPPDGLARTQMHKGVKNLHTLLDMRDRVKGRIDHIDHHDLHLLHSRPELVVVLVPGRGLHVNDRLLDPSELEQVLLESGLHLQWENKITSRESNS